MNRRLVVTLLTIILLLITAFPGMAKSETIPISGTCYIIKWAAEDGGLTADPNYRMWGTDSIGHWRNMLWLFSCDYDDDRLDGYMLLSDNWNLNFNEQPKNLAHSFGEAYSADVDGNILNLWEGSSVGTADQMWNLTVATNYHGIGIYQGLHARFITIKDSDPENYIYYVTGELTDTGK